MPSQSDSIITEKLVKDLRKKFAYLDEVTDEALAEAFTAILGSLIERERKVLELTYMEGLSGSEVGSRLGLTRSRIQQIRSRALRRIVRPFYLKTEKNPYIKYEPQWNTAECNANAHFDNCGFIVGNVEFKVMYDATSLRIAISVTDREKFASVHDGLRFKFLNATGGCRYTSKTAGGSIKSVSSSTAYYTFRDTYYPLEFLPEEIILCGYNTKSGEEYGTHTLLIKKNKRSDEMMQRKREFWRK